MEDRGDLLVIKLIFKLIFKGSLRAAGQALLILKDVSPLTQGAKQNNIYLPVLDLFTIEEILSYFFILDISRAAMHFIFRRTGSCRITVSLVPAQTVFSMKVLISIIMCNTIIM